MSTQNEKSLMIDADDSDMYKENYLKHIELYKLMIRLPITIDDASHYMK